jgi:hypothetical protein
LCFASHVAAGHVTGETQLIAFLSESSCGENQ